MSDEYPQWSRPLILFVEICGLDPYYSLLCATELCNNLSGFFHFSNQQIILT